MGLFGRKATTVGLDIGSGLIKLVAISHSANGPVLTKVAFTSVSNDAIVEGEIMDPGMVAEAIAGQAGRFDLLARIRHLRFPGGALMRTPALVLGMWYYRLRDAL